MGREEDVSRVREIPLTGSKFQPSQRSAVDPFLAMEVLQAAVEREAAGHRVIHMEVGQPGAPAPRPVLEAARRALEDGRFRYTEALGLRRLRERIAAHYHHAYGMDVPHTRIAVTTGSSAGFNLAFLSAFDHGDRIALATPGYPAYRNLLGARGLEVVNIETGAESG
jgi:aspartate/methionine/tyrosine aminotransferase